MACRLGVTWLNMPLPANACDVAICAIWAVPLPRSHRQVIAVLLPRPHMQMAAGATPDAAVQVQVQRKAVADEVTETQAAQIELDTTAEEFRNLHKERQGLLAQWDDTIQGMRR